MPMLLPLLIEIKPQSLDSGMSSIIRKVQNELEVILVQPSDHAAMFCFLDQCQNQRFPN
jgi:hypothetical protein